MNKTEELSAPTNNYSLLSIKGVVDNAIEIRKELMSKTTDKFYIDSKNGFLYVKGSYMDDLFKTMYPIHHIKIIEQKIIGNAWIVTSVEIEAYLSPSIYISNPGTGGQRLMLPKEYNDHAKQLKKDGKMVERLNFLNSLSPIDWIDVGNDAKSSLSKAISNAQSKFGCAADIYNKGIIPSEIRVKIVAAVEELISKLSPMEQIRAKKSWQECQDAKQNIYSYYKRLAKHMGFTEDSEINI